MGINDLSYFFYATYNYIIKNYLQQSIKDFHRIYAIKAILGLTGFLDRRIFVLVVQMNHLLPEDQMELEIATQIYKVSALILLSTSTRSD